MKKLFDTYKGKSVYLYTLKEENIEVDIIDFGARINSIRVNGIDIVLGCNKVEDYFHDNCYLGATIGRNANRIEDSKFVLNNVEYKLTNNENKNQLHGGLEGFDKKIFKLENFDNNKLELSYFSKDGEEGFPGNLKLNVIYTLKDKKLKIEYKAVADKDTIFAPTCHAYFNLNGEGTGYALDNLLFINANEITLTKEGLISTGEKMKVEGTPFDFRQFRAIDKFKDDKALLNTKGYDHNFMLNGSHAATVKSEKTGIKMDIYTDMPGVQLYTSGFLKVNNGKNGPYNENEGFALEPQFVPNSINLEGFDKPILRKGENAYHYIEYRF